jgi:hypothetical protein
MHLGGGLVLHNPIIYFGNSYPQKFSSPKRSIQCHFPNHPHVWNKRAIWRLCAPLCRRGCYVNAPQKMIRRMLPSCAIVFILPLSDSCSVSGAELLLLAPRKLGEKVWIWIEYWFQCVQIHWFGGFRLPSTPPMPLLRSYFSALNILSSRSSDMLMKKWWNDIIITS